MADNRRRGGRILVDQLRLHGVDLCFGVPGESYLAVLDAFVDVDRPRFVLGRQEGGVAMMAEAHGKLTGRPGIAFVTRGPGATNAAAGVHVAQQDSTPMILFIGQIERGAKGRDAFQEVDYVQMFGGIAKWSAEIDRVERIPEMVRRAFQTATSGRPGPVVLALPEDMLIEHSDVEDAPAWARVGSAPAPSDMARLNAMLRAATAPVLILGGGGWTAEAAADIRGFAQRFDLPVTCGFRRQDLFDNEHGSYVGEIAIGPNPDLVRHVQSSDLVLAVGTRLSEMTTQSYTLLGIPDPGCPLVHIHADPEELGRVYAPSLAICATMPETAAALAALDAPASRPWSAARDALRRSYLAWREPPAVPGALKMGEVVRYLRRTLPRDVIITNGAGNYCVFVNRFSSYGGAWRTQVAPVSGSMGYGLPAAIAAKLTHPERTVVCFAGDGCFQMTGQELSTAVQEKLGLIILVANNGMYGTIRMHQEREYPTRVSGTALVNPDFAALARAHGCFGTTVTRDEDFAPAFAKAQAEAVAGGVPALIELVLDPEALTPKASLSEIRATAQAAGR